MDTGVIAVTTADVEARVRQLFETVPSMINVTSTDGQLEYVTHAILDLMGVRFEDIEGVKWVNFLHPDDAKGIFQEWLRCSSAKQPFKYCYRVRTRHGTYRWCQSKLKPLLDSHGQVVKFYGCLADIDDPPFEPPRRTYRTLLPSVDGLDNSRLRRVLEHIATHIDGEIRIADLARIAGYSLFHFARKFTHAMGLPPLRYISRLRLEKAMDELAKTSKSLATIALDANFSSQSSFTRAFHHATGTTPREYRQRVAPARQADRHDWTARP